MQITACLIALTLAATPALAEDCTNPQTQTDMNICADQEFAQADAALNATYKKLLAKITPAGQTSLRRAEKSWLAYRDAQCAFNTLGSAAGSVNPMVALQCKTALTLDQTRLLAAQLNCQEGDLSCGGQ